MTQHFNLDEDSSILGFIASAADHERTRRLLAVAHKGEDEEGFIRIYDYDAVNPPPEPPASMQFDLVQAREFAFQLLRLCVAAEPGQDGEWPPHLPDVFDTIVGEIEKGRHVCEGMVEMVGRTAQLLPAHQFIRTTHALTEALEEDGLR